MATTLNAGTTAATALNVITDTTGAMAIQTSGTTAIAISTAQVVSLTNALLPASGGTGITSLGTGVATFLGTPSSANLAAALTDETGTGANVFATSPTLVTPILGTPTSGTLTSCTGLPLTTGVTGTLPIANGGTGTTSTTFANLTTNVTGTLPVANGGTGVTTSTGTGAVVLGTGPTISSPVFSGTPSGVGILTSGTAVASTSGTNIDFTSIPSWVKRITFMFDGLSSNGGSSIQIQIGNSGGIETTGYISGNAYGSLTTGFVLALNPGAAYLQYGTMVFTNLSGNTWVQNGNSLATGIAVQPVCGSKTLSATLDRIRLTTVNGTDTFDAGSVNILYE